MSKKYVIDLPDDAQYILINGASENHCYTRVEQVDDLEELNSDYINEHYGELQDEAYQKGINDGSLDVKQRVEGAYQAGLNDAWEAVKKIFGYEIDGALSIDEIGEAFGYKKEDVFYTADIIRANTAEQVIAKLKAYEEKKADKIEVGDIIANNTEPKLKVWVTCFDEIGFCGIAITDFGTVDGGKLYSSCSPKGWHKIGHFDIDKILEEMRHD